MKSIARIVSSLQMVASLAPDLFGRELPASHRVPARTKSTPLLRPSHISFLPALVGTGHPCGHPNQHRKVSVSTGLAFPNRFQREALHSRINKLISIQLCVNLAHLHQRLKTTSREHSQTHTTNCTSQRPCRPEVGPMLRILPEADLSPWPRPGLEQLGAPTRAWP
jgi:hypothetical protein